jgi:Asp-tRNA(Asn)/Glu-tRNA(Gln) amidotransferase A subunit family amidase
MRANGRFLDWTKLNKDERALIAASAARRAGRLEPLLNAFVEIRSADIDPSPEGALALAPYAAKDIFMAAGRRPRGGLAELLDFGLSGCAEVLSQLDVAGAFRVGFTAMTELAYEPSGFNAVAPGARNPWNPDFIPGGSSSGSAVAVASGSVVLALGSDTGGSVRIPAQCCGVTGWKPTWGTVSAAGALPLAPYLDTIGLLARSAAELAPAARVLSADAQLRSGIEHVVFCGDALDESEVEIRRGCLDLIESVRGCGITASRVDILPAIAAIDRHVLVVMQGEAARTFGGQIDHVAISPVLRRRLAKGLTISDAELSASRAKRAQLAKEFGDAVLGKADAAILPVMPIRTPMVSDVDPGSPSFSGRRLYELSRYCRFVNMLGFPAVAIPAGFDDRGLPVALQAIGRPGRDGDLIALAMKVQKKTDWHGRIPAAVRDLVRAEEGLNK